MGLDKSTYWSNPKPIFEADAITKRNAAGEPDPKQPLVWLMDNDRMLNPYGTTKEPVPTKKVAVPRKVDRRRKPKKTHKKKGVEAHVGKYEVIAEFANAATSLMFGHFMRGDAE